MWWLRQYFEASAESEKRPLLDNGQAPKSLGSSFSDFQIQPPSSARMSAVSSTRFGAPFFATSSIARPISSVVSTCRGNIFRITGKIGAVT